MQPHKEKLYYQRVVVIDNYDSFTYNLVDYLRQLGCSVTIYRNTIDPMAISPEAFDLLVLSPGPSIPRNAGNLMQIIARFHTLKPILGICLGHQALVEFFGGHISKVMPRHGKAEKIVHDGLTLYTGLQQQVEVARYHSWAATTVPEVLQVSARAADGTVMGVRHKLLPIEGLQYHPESILSLRGDAGMHILRNAVTGKLVNGYTNYKQLMADMQRTESLKDETIEDFIAAITQGHLNDDQRLVLMVSLAYGLRDTGSMARFINALLSKGKFENRDLLTHVYHHSDAVDVCGTGGSGLPRLNTSTLAALLLASQGLPIVKHGNKAASGRFGSFDLLEKLGVPIRLSTAEINRALQETRLAFLFAADLHPVVGHFVSSRARIGIPTLFNVLGPLLNPLLPRRQLVGTAFAEYMQQICEVGVALGREELYVVRGDEGLDDISVSEATQVVAYVSGRHERFTLQPEDFGIARVQAQAVQVHTPEENVRIAREIIQGQLNSEHYKQVAVNAAFAYTRFVQEMPLTQAYAQMVDAISAGALAEQLEKYQQALTLQPEPQLA